jgi:hypothetical protein
LSLANPSSADANPSFLEFDELDQIFERVQVQSITDQVLAFTDAQSLFCRPPELLGDP